jgi:hypothetical protein
MQWTLLPAFYTLMQVFLVASYVTVDWHAIAHNIIMTSLRGSRRQDVDSLQAGETTPLVVSKR